MPNYSLPTSQNINASGGFIDILNYVNEVTFSWVSRMLLIAIFVIILMTYYNTKRDFVGGFAIAGFGTFVIALLFFIGGFVSIAELVITLAILIVSVGWILFDRQGTA